MRIGLGLIFLVPDKLGGIETYCRGLISGLAEIDQSNEYILFANRENFHTWKTLPSNFKVYECPVYGGQKVSRTLFELFKFNSLLDTLGIEVYHSLASTIPPKTSKRKVLVTIHDIIFKKFPQEFGLIQRLVASTMFYYSATHADRIIVDSNFTKNDIIEEYKISSEKITVSYLDSAKLDAGLDNSKDVLTKYKIDSPYLLSVSSTYHHKNFVGLLKAFSILKSKYKIPHKLVCTGLKMAGHEEFMDNLELNEYKDDIIYAGYVNRTELFHLYSQADVFVFPSLYEGFGIPVLEAMKIGTPVACSNLTSIPEVAGDAAALFDPYNVESMVESIHQILINQNYKLELIQKGKQRASTFSYNRCARETLDAYLASI